MRKQWWIFLVTTSGTSVVFLDHTALPVALPTIQRELLFSPLYLLWVVNAYLLSLTALLLVGGKLSDLWGRRTIFVSGLLIFGLGSLVCALAPLHWWMVLGRVIQGVGGALIIPTTGALLIASFPPGRRAQAIGWNTGISSLFLILGPALGALLTQYSSWRAIFFINLPFVAFGVWMSMLLLSPGGGKRTPFPWGGALAFLAAVVPLVLGLMEGNRWGWSHPVTLLLLGMSPCFFWLFWRLSVRAPSPLLDFRLFRNSLFTSATFFIFLTQIIIMVTVLWAIYFQNHLGYTLLETGLVIFLAVSPVMVVAPLGGYLGDRFGMRLPLLLGFSLLTGGLFWIMECVRTVKLLWLVPGLFAFGSGIPLIFSPAIALALSQVAPEELGAASGITMESRQLASTVGLSLMTALYYTILQQTDSHSLACGAISLLAGCLALIGLLLTSVAIPRKK